MAQILVFGDSIAYGAWDREGGWVQRLRRYLDKKAIPSKGLYDVVYNLGVDANTTQNVLSRFESETKSRLWPGQETIFIFSIGLNDSVFGIPLEKTKSNFKKLIKFAKKYSKKIIFVGDQPFDESKTNPVCWDKNVHYTNQTIKNYNSILKVICKQNKVYFIELYDKLSKLNWKSMLEDGVHPNSKGHEMIFKIVKDYMIKNRIINSK